MKRTIGLIALICLSIVSLTASAKRYTSVDDTKDIIQNIISVVGLKPKFEIKEGNIPNAAAVIFNRKRYVVYNPKFVATLNKAAGNQWASVSILAHEIGHHLNGHTLEAGGSTPELELEADEFSGFVLQKMGATLPEAQVAMKIAAAQRESHTHPAQARRLVAIAQGWKNAQQLAGNNDVAKKYQKAPASEVQIDQPAAGVSKTKPTTVNNSSVIAEQYIIKDIVFNADRSSSYYITTRNNVVKVKGKSLAVVGKLVRSNSTEFPMIIYDEDKNYLLVHKQGSIVTTTGRKVGYVTEHN